MNPNWRSLFVMLFDLLVVAVAWFLAFALRFNFEIPTNYGELLVTALPLLLLVEAVVFRLMGLYRGIWIFASLPDLQRILHAVGLSALLLAGISMMLRPDPSVPRSILILFPMLLLFGMAGGRVAYRMWRERALHALRNVSGRPVLILGAGQAGAMLARELQRSGEWRVVGFLDDDEVKRGLEIQGCKVLGPIADLEFHSDKYGVKHAIVAIPSTTGPAWRKVLNTCVRAGITAYTTPTLTQLLIDHDAITQVRKVHVEDLLGREQVRIDVPQVREMVGDRVILVTGAGGSIGSELCRQVARFQPRRLVLVDHGEYALYRLVEEFSEFFPDVPIAALAGDVLDAGRMDQVVQEYAPDVVFHAAAYKHVPLMETHNAWQAARNNILGTLTVAEVACRFAVSRFVLVSTDKAVNPTNVMGATKRLAEMVCLALQAGGTSTRFEMVRFGNVLGSAGSVIPKFQAQIERGGPVTVTHPEITRYFMSIPEAAQLVLQAAAMGEGGEIFVLDMGEPVRIVDLARDMIRLAGREEDEIHIEFTGLRPGEKLYEELLADSEATRTTHHPKVRVARSRTVADDFLGSVRVWLASTAPRSDDEVREALGRWIPEYTGGPVGRVAEIPKTAAARSGWKHSGDEQV